MAPDILITFIIKTRTRKYNFSDGFKLDSHCRKYKGDQSDLDKLMKGDHFLGLAAVTQFFVFYLTVIIGISSSQASLSTVPPSSIHFRAHSSDTEFYLQQSKNFD